VSFGTCSHGVRPLGSCVSLGIKTLSLDLVLSLSSSELQYLVD